MFEVVFLGTAAGVPSVERGLPALIVLHGGGGSWWTAARAPNASC